MHISSITHYNEDNVIEVFIHTWDTNFAGARFFTLPCDLTTRKTPGPVVKGRKTVRYSVQEQLEDPSINDYLPPQRGLFKVIETKTRTYPNDPEIDHVDDVYLDDEKHLVVVLHPAGVRQAKGFSGNDEWVLMIDNDGRICLRLAFPINIESVPLAEKCTYDLHEDDIPF